MLKFSLYLNCTYVYVCIPAVAPLCFLYNEPSKLYGVFREMYVRYFFRLHAISSSPSVSTYYRMCTYWRPVCALRLFFVCTHSYVCMCVLQGIVSLCLQFERLLQTHLPQLFYHLQEIGAQP